MKITKIVQKHINTHGANWWQVNLKVGGGGGGGIWAKTVSRQIGGGRLRLERASKAGT